MAVWLFPSFMIRLSWHRFVGSGFGWVGLVSLDWDGFVCPFAIDGRRYQCIGFRVCIGCFV